MVLADGWRGGTTPGAEVAGHLGNRTGLEPRQDPMNPASGSDAVIGRMEMRIQKCNICATWVAFAMVGAIAAASPTVFAATGAGSSSEASPAATSGSPGRRPVEQGQPAAGNYGPGYGPGYGRGRGMMGGWNGGYGPGMMGRWSGEYGPGMMNGWGGGWGGGYGMGPGMMRGRGLAAIGLDLSAEQETRIEKIHAEVADARWSLAGKVFAAVGELHELLAGEAPDRAAVQAAYKKLSDLRLQQIEATLDTRAKVDAVLTQEQRERLQSWRGDAFGPVR